MPLTSKGKKIMSAMQRPKSEGGYGAKKGKEVFYASQNKGTITGTHKTGEAQSPQWLEGFTKAANDRGLTDPDQVVALLKIAQRLHFMHTHTEQYAEGYEGAMLKQGMTKEAIPWKFLAGLGLGGAGMLGAQAGARNAGIRPFNRQHWTVEDLQNAANEYKDVASRTRPYTSPFGMMGQQNMYRPSYFSQFAGGMPPPVY